MKKCPKCNKKYTDDKEYCKDCGCKLEKILSKYIYIVIGIIIMCLIGNYFVFSDFNKYDDSKTNKYSYDSFSNYNSSPTTNDLSIVSWDSYSQREYTYIEGSVKNTGSQTISYYKITAKYYNRYTKDIVDSDFTNSAEDLEPGESRKFEIMTKGVYREEDIKLLVDEVH